MNDDNVDDVVTITGDEYLMLYRRSKELDALEDAGVDSWERYGYGDMFDRVERMVEQEAHQRGLMYDGDDESDMTDVTAMMNRLGLCGTCEDQSRQLSYAAEQRRKKMRNAGMFINH